MTAPTTISPAPAQPASTELPTARPQRRSDRLITTPKVTAEPSGAPAVSPTGAPPALAGSTDAPAAGRDELLGAFYDAGFAVSRTDCWLAAIAFYRREGHLRVPRKHHERGINLYRLITQIRAKRRAGILTDTQIAVWDAIGMLWPQYRPGGRVLTTRQRAEVVRRYTQQNPQPSMRALAAEFGCSYTTIHSVLEQVRTTVRAEGATRVPTGGQPADNGLSTLRQTVTSAPSGQLRSSVRSVG